tara:strand:+ start:63058 stop:63552 length:495 start_codon:yes stop_codon:yes gene_type:complete
MELKQALKKLEESMQFKDWKKKNPETFFSYALKTPDDDSWNLGFYHKTTDKMTTFTIHQEIEMNEEEEIFKKPDMEVNPIDVKNVKLPLKEILKKAEDFQKEKYPKELANKTIIILQNLKEYGNVWNITLVTHTFKTLNIKISPENGEIKYHSLDSLMDFVENK